MWRDALPDSYTSSRPPRCLRAYDAAQKAVALKDRYTFKTDMDEEAKRAMFPGNYRAQAAA